MSRKTESHAKHVPEFSDLQEAAEFWDEHSPLDFPDHFEDVDIGDNRPSRKKGITVRLEQHTIDELTSIARERGIGPSTLARMWILEHLRAHSSDPDARRPAWHEEACCFGSGRRRDNRAV
jgi:hypothetical protein